MAAICGQRANPCASGRGRARHSGKELFGLPRSGADVGAGLAAAGHHAQGRQARRGCRTGQRGGKPVVPGCRRQGRAENAAGQAGVEHGRTRHHQAMDSGRRQVGCRRSATAGVFVVVAQETAASAGSGRKERRLGTKSDRRFRAEQTGREGIAASPRGGIRLRWCGGCTTM